MKLSFTKKMSGVPSWGLPVGSSCPGAFDKNGHWVETCNFCYAREGRYRFKNVISSREENLEQLKNPEWVNTMTKKIRIFSEFRWLDSGDIPDENCAEKILRVCQKTPRTRHWLPTRSFIVPEIYKILEKIKKLENVVVRYSSSKIDSFDPNIHGSVVITNTNIKNIFVCPSYLQDGKCESCRACWKASIPVIGYMGHGKRWNKIHHVIK